MTNMSLQMLRLLVLRDVIQKTGFIGEAFVTTVTFVGLICLMTPGVGLKVRELRKRFITTGMSAFVRLIARMRPNMLLQVRQLRELSLAYLAPVGLNA